MQSINRAILNPIFLLIFVGSPLFLITSLIQENKNSSFFVFLLFSTLLVVIGQFGITATQNVPLNNRLEDVDLNDLSEEEITELRIWYEGPWNRWHIIRTLASVLGLTLLIVGLIQQ